MRYFIEKSGGHLDWNAARKLFMPVLSALSALHENGIDIMVFSGFSQYHGKWKMKLGDFVLKQSAVKEADCRPT
ncbi:MAG: hypothetical protein ACLR13_00415 [Acutalibacteraceae bacterium]